PRMGGERFLTLSFHPGLLDVTTGKLPWSTEAWHEVVSACRHAGSPGQWFAQVGGTCANMLADRRAALDAVIDRYDYVLMIDPPDYGRDLVAPHVKLVSHVGSAWMFQVVPSGRSSTEGS